ncbi:autotransporter outer membrane beta-barrel domain-containing protein [Rubritepida flocculans]|uniref:autotransporter outer membrane beta-barrel domain-containing protein n=1 Tax=Rubritepida flocculans TaxID=182403 RepID=UPI0003FA8E56|nr:autotransporter domain-containing protein [Rubritepida flocculans]
MALRHLPFHPAGRSALLASTALVAFIVLGAAPAHPQGGTANAGFGAGGASNATTAGGDGTASFGSGGGGAGVTGGAGGTSFGGVAGGAGGATPGAAGAAGQSGTGGNGGGGGGGGAHGAVGAALPFSARTGGAGGAGGDGGSNSGGGGGAGGWGAVVTGDGNQGLLTHALTGGAGGRGGDSLGTRAAGGGAGGHGLALTGFAPSLSVGSAVTGGDGGDGGLRDNGTRGAGGAGGDGISAGMGASLTINQGAVVTGGQAGLGTSGAGGAGISGSGLSITNAGTITGGLAADGTTRHAVRFTGGVNNLTLGATSVIQGSLVMSGGATLRITPDSGGSILSSSITGGNGLMKLGAGTLILTGANSYGGGTTINAGILQIGNGGTTGTLGGGAVMNNATLRFDRSDSLTFGGNMAGSGLLVQAGAGTLILTGALTHTGGTSIEAGRTLQIGNGGTTGSLAGAVANAGTLRFDRSDSLTFGGSISGPGTLVQAGSGTLILTGGNAHTGGTTILAGRLQVGDGGATGSLGSGTITNNGTLAFNRSDTVTFSNAIQGSGNLEQNGTGNLILSGVLTYTGQTIVNAGVLTITGSLTGTSGAVVRGGRLVINGQLPASASVTVDAGATLGGSGTLGGVTVNGRLSPGNSIGTISLASLTLNPGATTVIEVQGASSDRILVSGLATLGGTLQLVALGGSYSFNTPYVILQAGSVAGSFAQVSTQGAFGAGVTPRVTTSATEVRLFLEPALLVTPETPVEPQAPQPAAATPAPVRLVTFNQRSVAAALDAGNRAGADMSRFFNVYNQPAERIGAAVNQLSGEVATAVPAMGFAAGGQFLGAMLAPRAFPAGLHVWGSATGGQERVAGSGSDGSAARTTRASGFVLGLDRGVSGLGSAGVALAAGEAEARLGGGMGSARASFGQIGVHGQTRLGSVTLAGAAGVTFMDASTRRTVTPVVAERARNGLDGQVYSLRAQAVHDGVALGGARVQPVAAIQWQHAQIRGGAERDTTGGVTVPGQGQGMLRSELGAQVQGSFELGGRSLRAGARLAWAHYLQRDAALGVGLSGLPDAGFTVRGARPEANAALLSASVEAPLTSRLTFTARLDSEISGNTRNASGTARLRYSF